MLGPAGASVRDIPPRSRPDVRLSCTLSGLAGVWLGRQSLADAVREQTIVFVGSAADVRSLITCVGVDRYTELAPEPA